MSIEEELRVWKEECELGAGSFGRVRLFVNKKTDRKIALKEMKSECLTNMDPAKRSDVVMRMRQEIKIMWEHSHDNLVRALCPPQDMTYNPADDVMHVWMEYCNGGDLRKGLMREPENCCGLPEYQIRGILHGINNGLRFLHKNSIIHRDLKPENILIQRCNNQVVYKLTDFGYAKIYNLSSQGKSLVGTPQYVAPEIIMSRGHGSTVDFWSFAVIAFELLTLQRPFLHNDPSMFEWLHPVTKKAQQCIHIYWGDDPTQPIYSNTLPRPNQASRPLSDKLTTWLQMALSYEPADRGGVSDHIHDEEAPCLLEMDKLLQAKEVEVVCMSTGEVHSFNISDDSTLTDLHCWYQQSYGVEQAEQYLVTVKNGRGVLHVPTSDTQLISTACDMEGSVGRFYMFTCSQDPSFKLVPSSVCPRVDDLIRIGDQCINEFDLLSVYAQAFFQLREQWRSFERLYDGHSAIRCEMEKMHSEIRLFSERGRGGLTTQCQETLAVTEHIRSIHDEDIARLNDSGQVKDLPSLAVATCRNEWINELGKLDECYEKFKDCYESSCKFDEEVESVLYLTEERFRSHSECLSHLNNFKQQFVDNALRYYCDYKSSKIPLHQLSSTQGTMCDLVINSMAVAESLIKDHFNGINYMTLYVKLRHTLNEYKQLKSTLSTTKENADKASSAIRKGLWNLVQHPPTRPLSRQSSMQQSSEDPDPDQRPRPLINSTWVSQGSRDSEPAIGSPFRKKRASRQDSTASAAGREVSKLMKMLSYTGSAGTSSTDESIDIVVSSLKDLMRIVSSESDSEISRNKEVMERVNSVLPTTVDGGLSFQGLEEEKLEKVKEDSKEEERMDDS